MTPFGCGSTPHSDEDLGVSHGLAPGGKACAAIGPDSTSLPRGLVRELLSRWSLWPRDNRQRGLVMFTERLGSYNGSISEGDNRWSQGRSGDLRSGPVARTTAFRSGA